MTASTYDTVAVGDILPPLQLPPVDRTTLALFAGASGDHNAIHVDLDVARRAGMPDVFAQGITHLGNAMRCSGRVVEKLEHHGERCVRIELQSANQFGQTKIVGEALVALP